MILSFEDYALQSQKLAQAVDMPCHIIQVHRFPDAENKLTLPQSLPEHVVFCRSLNQPNEKLVELLLAARTARELGAKELTLIAPYLCYMRQDMAFHPGEAVSQNIVGNFLAALFDNIVTVDPHLHRIQYLHQAVPARNAVSLSATGLMAGFLRDRKLNPVILGPDSEAIQWVKAVAQDDGWDHAFCHKTRHGDRDVEISLPDLDIRDRHVVLVDDVCSSGQTMVVAAGMCLSSHAAQVDILVTHALFSADSEQHLIEAGVANVWSTDSVQHESNIISLQNLLADAIVNLA